MADVQDKQRNRGGNQHRQGDIPDFLQLGCAVQRGRLIMLRIDIGQRGQIDDGPPAGAGPHAGPDVHVRESGGAFHEGNGLAAQHADEHIYHAARTHQGRGRGKHLLHNTHDDNRGNKVRSIGNNLYRFLELRAAQLVHHQRQQQAQ